MLLIGCLAHSGGFIQSSVSISRLCINRRKEFSRNRVNQQQVRALTGSGLADPGGGKQKLENHLVQ